MPEKKGEAYYRKVVRNSYINEYRANDNQAKHITVDSGLLDQSETAYWIEDVVFREMERASNRGWLQTISNQSLLRALQQLKPKDLEFIHTMMINSFTTYEMAEHLGCSQSSAAERYRRIKEKIKFLMQKPD